MAVLDLVQIPTVLLVQSAGNQSCYGTGACGSLINACDYTFGDESIYESDPDLYEAVAGRILVAGGSDEFDGRWTNRNGDPGVPPGTSNPPGSNGGECIDIFAPAAHILSASNLANNGYCHLSGTSMAAPHVVGIAARILQGEPDLPAADLKQAILEEGLVGMLQSNPSHPNYIGPGAPNLVLHAGARCGAP
jgi:subtilisin family serine protease